MAESNGNGNGNGHKLERAAESLLLQVVARWFIVAGLPIFGVLIGYIGLGWLAEMRGIGQEVRDLGREVRSEFKETDQRINGLDVRLTGVERDVDNLRAR